MDFTLLKPEKMELEDESRKPERMDSEVDFSVLRNACSRTTPLERKLFVIIAVLVAVGIGLTIALAIINRESYCSLELKPGGNNESQICHTSPCTTGENYCNSKLKPAGNNESQICCTSSCITGASNLMNSMDLTVDPCTDFYSFVCGNWMKNASLPSSKESQFTKMAKTIILRVKEILDDLEKVEDLPDHKRKLSNFYQSCVNKNHRDILGAQELLSDLDKLGGWPLIKEDWDASAFSWSNLMVDLFKNGYINNMLFSITVSYDARNTSRSLICVGNPTLGRRNKKFYEHPRDDTMLAYKTAIYRFAKLLKDEIDEGKSMAAIENAFKIEIQLHKISQDVDINNPETFYHITTLVELEKSNPMIPWRKLLQELLPYGTELSDEERIMVTAPSMLKALNDILEDLNSSHDGKEVLANYMFYRSVLHASGHLNMHFNRVIQHYLDPNVEYATWKGCIKLAMDSFPSSLTASYVTKYMDNTTRHFLKGMLDDLRNALLDDIEKSGWLDDETKQHALLKVKKMQSIIAYPDEIMDDEILNDFYKDINIADDHFNNFKQIELFNFKKRMEGLHDVREIFRRYNDKKMLTTNAYYRNVQNWIIIPLGLLQDPIFAPGRPNYMTYGILGMIVGHELAHAFDSIGWKHDAEGNYRMWSSPNSWIKFQDITKCFKDQYSKYYVPAAGTFVNGTFTLDENMADNRGLQTAYNAYMKALKRTRSEKLLPGLPYNARQMFWISFASVFCERGTDESIKRLMTTDKYAPSHFRVIGSLSNMEEFSRDFNCKLNSTKNPQSKCSLWQ